MIINFNSILYAISYALDCVERELLGVATNHSKRVALIATEMGKQCNLTTDELIDLAACAILHDNALAQYIKTEINRERLENSSKEELAIHCEMGEKNITGFPFHTDVRGAILYHHENADGSGCFGLLQEETPLFAQLIHFADILDIDCNLGEKENNKYQNVKEYLQERSGTVFAEEHVNLFLTIFSPHRFLLLQDTSIDQMVKESIPVRFDEFDEADLIHIAGIFAEIIDYKSEFTKKHSIGIAEKAKIMSEYYGFDEETIGKMYLAGALHDIGKVIINSNVLEKPDKLTAKEYIYIKNHAKYSYDILSKIEGLEDVTSWACMHHEKLDGSGYPFGKKASELGQKERLMACLDIYQALTEERPYKSGMSHEISMEILYDMAEQGLIDGEICRDIDLRFGKTHQLTKYDDLKVESQNL